MDALGIDSVWLSPFYEFGGVDMGYDWTDHTVVDGRFGNDTDVDALFEALLDIGRLLHYMIRRTGILM